MVALFVTMYYVALDLFVSDGWFYDSIPFSSFSEQYHSTLLLGFHRLKSSLWLHQLAPGGAYLAVKPMNLDISATAILCSNMFRKSNKSL